MKKTKLTAQILNLVIMVQDYKRAIHSQNLFYNLIGKTELIKDTYEESKDFFNNIGNDVLKEMGLSTNLISFEKVMDFKVTKEMTETLYDDLGKFDF